MTMQKIATQIFIIASVLFGVLGILVVIMQPKDGDLLSRLLLADVFIILPSFALSIASKYLSERP